MVTLLSNSTPITASKFPLLIKFQTPILLSYDRPLKFFTPRRRISVNLARRKNAVQSSYSDQHQQPRTLFPGGFKRPEIKIPSLVLKLSSEEVLGRENVVDSIDFAVSNKWVGIVVVGGTEGSGGKLYEAARLLKSVIRDRAYLLVDERVDIAAAIGANGVVLSDQGLPAIAARNIMMESKSESVILPLVGRSVNTADAALSASNSEGADFLIYSNDSGSYRDMLVNSIFQDVKVPIFTTIALVGGDSVVADASKLLRSGASGIFISLDEMKLFNDAALSKLFSSVNVMSKRTQDGYKISSEVRKTDLLDHVQSGLTPSINLEEREKEFIKTEKTVLIETMSVIRKAAPQMEEVSLLTDAVSRLDEPFLLVIVGEFNSGKSSVINGLLGKKYLKEGVVPTTNEITLLCYAEMDAREQERCERHPDGQFICYLPAPILKRMNLVDTPGTNVILQRQQRLTEEFVPRSDLILFVISADRPLTASEVAFLQYIQQWKKKVVFVLNKSDLYQSKTELEEAIAFIKENTQKLLSAENVTLYPVSARSAMEAKFSLGLDDENIIRELLESDYRWKNSGFYELEKFLYSFLDGSSDTGIERMRLKLETPIRIADRLIDACETLAKKDQKSAIQDLVSVSEIVGRVKEHTQKMELDSMSWKRQTLSLVDTARARTVRLIESTLKLSNLDLVASYVFKGEKSDLMRASSSVQNGIIDPALSDTQKLLGEYRMWLKSQNEREGRIYKDSFEKKWPSSVYQQIGNYELQRKDLSLKTIENFSASAAAKLFDQEIREVVLGTFGGLGAAGVSASLLTTVLPTTSEDLLALGLCSAGGLLAISNFPTRRKEMTEKVRRVADGVARELEEAMTKDLLHSIEDLENFVKIISKPYQDAAQQRIDRSLKIQEELTNIRKKLQTLLIEIQNVHVS